MARPVPQGLASWRDRPVRQDVGATDGLASSSVPHQIRTWSFHRAVLPPAGTAPAPDTVEIPLTPPAYRTIGLAWPANRPQPPAVRTFRDHALTTRSG